MGSELNYRISAPREVTRSLNQGVGNTRAWLLHYDRTIPSSCCLNVSYLGQMIEDVIVFSDWGVSPQFYGSHPAHCQHGERYVSSKVELVETARAEVT